MEEDGGPGLVEYALVTVLVAIVVLIILVLLPEVATVFVTESAVRIALGVVGLILLIIFGVTLFGGDSE